MFMKRVTFILKRLKHMQWKNLWSTAQKVSRKTKKPTIFICIDILFCGFKYGAGYMDYFEFEFFLLNKKERKTYLTTTLNNKIIAKYNDKKYFNVFSDKILFNNTFKNFIHRDYLDLQKASFSDFELFVKNKKSFIAKVVDSCGGKGIDIYKVSDFLNLNDLFLLLKEKRQFLLEELIQQEETMNSLYGGSINSLRVITFLKMNGEVEIMNIILRIGNGGVVDNFSSGGMYTFISDDGKILLPAIDEEGNIFEAHPITNTKIVGFQIPKFDQVILYVKKLAKVEQHVRYVGWDIAITKKSVDVIEGNEYSGVFQMKPSLSKTKEGLLSKYRKYMDI